jgi:NitT/TauT family transport system permease protein
VTLAGVVSLLTALALAGILQGMIAAGVVNEYVVPYPTDVVAALGRVIVEEGIPGRFLFTVGETLASCLLVLVVGLPLGWLLHRSARLRAAFEPWVAASAAAPLVLAYPLFLVLFGRSAWAIIVLGFASGVAPLVLKTAEGFSRVRRVLLDVGRSYRMTRAQEFRMILLPAALPEIFVGFRLALIFSLINIVAVEFLINFGGLGQLINELAERFDLPGTYAAICFVVLVSVFFFAILAQGERWLRRNA